MAAGVADIIPADDVKIKKKNKADRELQGLQNDFQSASQELFRSLMQDH